MLGRFDKMPLRAALIGALALLGCSDPVPPAASAGMTLHVSQGSGCPVTGVTYEIGNPAPTDFNSGEPIFDGEDGVHASCTVSGSGTYAIEADISQGVDHLTVSGGVVGPDGTGTATIRAYLKDALQSLQSKTPCALRAISTLDPATGGSVFQIKPGSAWVHFDCTDLAFEQYTCGADGTFLVGNCRK